MSSQTTIELRRMDRNAASEEEEHVGLLESIDEDQEKIHDLSAEGRGHRRQQLRTFTAHAKKRSRLNLFSRALIVTLLLALILHIVIELRKLSLASTPPASLRPESDYILSSFWDLNAVRTTRTYNWTIAEHTFNPDGVFRPMLLIDAQFPGPLIEANEGDEIVVHVNNAATNATSIHWHGLFQNGSNWMDGTVGVTQCPIAPGRSFTYRFNVTGQTGTYWYHSHMAMQMSDGLVGPIVVHARGDEEKNLQGIAYEQDRVVMVGDHYYDGSSELLMRYLAPDAENQEPVPQAALINGRGARNCKDVPDRKCDAVGRENALFELSPHKGTRLRFINVGAFAEFQVQIDEHEFHVTEVDGVDVHPQGIHRLNISPAQRYSIVITPPDSSQSSYWMRARMITHCFAYDEPELKEEVRAVIEYGDSTVDDASEPQSKDWPEVIEVACRDLNSSTLEPVRVLAPPQKADDIIFLRSSFQIGDWRLSRGYLNDSSYRPNLTHPTLQTFILEVASGNVEQLQSLSVPQGIKLPPLSTNALGSPSFSAQTPLVYQTTGGRRTIDILVQNFDDGSHPFHLHGHTFWVLASGHAYPPELGTLYSSGHLNLTNPLRRDTASVEAYGWTLIRFVADNPGVWAFHCHIGWHSEAGLAMQFLSMADEVKNWNVPKEVEELCAVNGVTNGAAPDDAIWVGNFG